MKRTVFSATAILLLIASAFGQTGLTGVKMKDIADVTGTGAAVQVFGASAGYARAYTIKALAANSADVRCGGSTVTASRGADLAAGQSIMWGPLSPDPTSPAGSMVIYDLSTVYCFIGSGDKVSLAFAQ